MKLYEIAAAVQGEIIGNPEQLILGLSPIDDIKPGFLVYAEGEKNIARAQESEAAAILTGQITESLNGNKPCLQVSHPHKAFIQLIHFFYPEKKVKPRIHPTAIIAENVTLGSDVTIEPFVVIGEGSVIGDHCHFKSHVTIGENVVIGHHTTLHPQVTIYDRTQIGNEVTIHASSVIGSDGFGYTYTNGEHLKIPHAGFVSIGDKVEIGANTVVDRATLGATVIGKGTKIDNLVQIAHSVKLGEHNILCAFTGIAGSTKSGNGVIFAANVGVSDHVEIDDGVILGARAGVPPKKHLKKGNVYLGSPARPRAKALEQELAVSRIPMMRKNQLSLSEKVKMLDKRVALIEEME